MYVEVYLVTDLVQSAPTLCDTSAFSLLTILKDSRSMVRTVRTCARNICLKIEAAARNGSR